MVKFKYADLHAKMDKKYENCTFTVSGYSSECASVITEHNICPLWPLLSNVQDKQKKVIGQNPVRIWKVAWARFHKEV